MRAAAVIVLALVSASTAVPASAADSHQPPPPPRVRGVKSGAIRIEAERPAAERHPGSPGKRSTRRATEPLYPYQVVEKQDNGTYCLRTYYTRDQTRAALINAVRQDTGNILAPTTYPPCPRQPRPAREVARDLAQEFWDERELPSPTLRAAPGWAITGKPVYLEILGDRERTIEVENPIGPDVVINARSEYVIDWGDPNDRSVTTTRSPGGPWPHGDVTHVYTDVGTVTITVTQRWTATWSAGDDGGTLTSLRTEGRLPDFRVVQLQAVRRR